MINYLLVYEYIYSALRLETMGCQQFLAGFPLDLGIILNFVGGLGGHSNTSYFQVALE